jgi:hypothetical protein
MGKNLDKKTQRCNMSARNFHLNSLNTVYGDYIVHTADAMQSAFHVTERGVVISLYVSKKRETFSIKTCFKFN